MRLLRFVKSQSKYTELQNGQEIILFASSGLCAICGFNFVANNINGPIEMETTNHVLNKCNMYQPERLKFKQLLAIELQNEFNKEVILDLLEEDNIETVLFVSYNRLFHLGLELDKIKYLKFDQICKMFCLKILEKRTKFMMDLPRISRIDILNQVK